MPKFRKKPVVIEAMQFDGSLDRAREICRWANDSLGPEDDRWCDYVELQGEPDAKDFIVHTMEGQMTASPGDWIIRGVHGEFYPCKPEIFAATYDAL